jgi:hypothetical protein
MKRIPFFAALFMTFFLLASFSLGAQASPGAQTIPFATPTPGPDGRIIYIAIEGDSCLRISGLMGISVDQLRSLNRLDENCTITAGQALLIGLGGPAIASPTPGPAQTATIAAPTPTVFPGTATICVLLYADINGDALRQTTENVVPGGAISVTGSSTGYSRTMATIGGTDPSCFDGAPEGEYNISVAAPEGFNPTTELNYNFKAVAGETSYVAFGVQLKELSSNNPGSDNNNSALLGILGGILLILGVGLGWYASRLRAGPKSNLKMENLKRR